MYLLIYLYYIFTLVVLQYLLHIMCFTSLYFMEHNFTILNQSINQYNFVLAYEPADLTVHPPQNDRECVHFIHIGV